MQLLSLKCSPAIINKQWVSALPITQSLLVSVMPKALCYTYTYLISTAIHLDASVETGRCLLYSAAGFDQIIMKSHSDCGEFALVHVACSWDSRQARGCTLSIPSE